MSVQKIFITLIIVVACVVIGAFVLNVLLPNVVKTLVNAIEDQLYKATKLSFDFNGDGHSGTVANSYAGNNSLNDAAGGDGVGVTGFN
jgi:uncharacterized membrane protein